MTSTADLDLLMDRAWPAPESQLIDGWQARFADGITRRANSVLPRTAPIDIDAALAEVEARYAERGLPPTFQITPAAQPADLDQLLAARGYRADAQTCVLVADVDQVCMRLASGASPAASTAIGDEPSESWMDLWWAVDGRGDDRARAIARSILTGVPARYASIVDDCGIAAVGRLALVHGWGGLYCMAVRPDARRRGLGSEIVRALAASAPGARLWLLVMASNEPARRLYARAGFVAASAYHYRVRDGG